MIMIMLIVIVKVKVIVILMLVSGFGPARWAAARWRHGVLAASAGRGAGRC